MSPGSRGLFSLARKYDRRQQRIERWRKPLASKRQRLRAWLSTIVAASGQQQAVALGAASAAGHRLGGEEGHQDGRESSRRQGVRLLAA
jgi:hypothetical protein